MRHLKKRLKINRTAAHRDAMIANMLNSLFKYEKIKTTKAKAKLLKPVAEKIITKSKNDTLASRRYVHKYLRRWDLIPKLFNDIGKRYKERPGGYTRIIPLGFRESDNAEMVILELVESYQNKTS